MTKRSRKYFEMKAFYKSSENAVGWLCSCGRFEHSLFHCAGCGRESPFGCNCEVCQGDYDEDPFYDQDPERIDGVNYSIYDYIYPPDPVNTGEMNPFVDDNLPF